MERPNRFVACDRSVLRRRKHILSQTSRGIVEFILQEIFPREVAFTGGSFICHPCWQRADRNIQTEQRRPAPPVQQVPDQRENPRPMDIGSFSLSGHSRASNTARRCIFEACRNVPSHAIPNYIKLYLLKNDNLYIPCHARVCNSHLTSNQWTELLLQRNHQDFSSNHMNDIINIYKWGLDRGSKDFEDLDTFEDNEFHFWTSLTKYTFNSILDQTPSLREKSRHPATVLGVYLSKIRTGETNERLATLFKMSRRALENKLSLARQCLTADYVPRYLGIDHIPIDDIVTRNLTIPNTFFGNQGRNAVVIMDGTYVYLQKSSNFLFQRKTYSLHKFRNLVKPFLLVSSDGYIIDVYGPYAATTSDATILSNLLSTESGLEWFFRQGDAFILDRGFRDAISIVEEYGFVPHMPPTRMHGEQQFSTIQANKSRLITMCRWVVEAINGRFKRDFKIFRQNYFNVTMPNMIIDFRIAAALINATQCVYVDNENAQQYIEIINEKMNTENTLAEYVVSNNINRQRVSFIRMEANDPQLTDFPRLEYEELLLITLGTYHLKLARSYCHEHLRGNNRYTIEMYRHPLLINNYTLIRGRIQSRHVRLRQYYTYILIEPSVAGREGIRGYYCSCIHGRHTVGCCAHIASILYYLSFARHLDVTQTPAAFLDEIIVIDYLD